MAIITREKVKTLLGIATSTTKYDDQIDELIPIVQDDIIRYLNNLFKNYAIEYNAKTISFSGNSITDSNSDFINQGFENGDYIVQGSKFNNMYVTVSNVTANTLTIDEDLEAESEENSITITRVTFHKGLQRIVANMIGFGISYKYGIKSETFSRYSVTYGSDTQDYINGYPDTITKGLSKWRKVMPDV